MVASWPPPPTTATLRIWDWRARRVLAKLPAKMDNGTPAAIALSPDGRLVATAGAQGTFVGDWRTRRLLWSTRPVDQYGYTTAAFSPDGTIVATGEGDDDAVYLWDWRRRKRIAVLREGEGSRGISFSPNGCLVATTGYDRWVRVWAPPLGGCR
jgi:WD40 repeat protein